MTLNKIISWICFLISFIPLAVLAQSTITSENFESYAAGTRLCTQAPAYWFTWNNGPGTAEDPEVTDSLAFQGNKSLLISGINDVLLDLNGKTSGRYEVAFFIRIPSGKVGFYGILHRFAGNESEWGIQGFFDAANQGTFEAGGTSVVFNFEHDVWFPVRNINDLDNDHAEIYVNGTLVVEWQWSLGLSGTPGIPRLDALNFFAWNTAQREPSMYVDSLLYKELPAPDPPRNLTDAVNGNMIILSWQAPASGTPAGYKVYRDSAVIASLVTELNYIDPDVYPGSYEYMVKAVYGSGMSQPAGPVAATVTGGTARKCVLLEIATGTWCTYCPGASMGADDLVNNGKEVAVLEYHDNDDYSNTDANFRNNNYYHVTGLPTAWFDGTGIVSGGNARQTMYPVYLPVYNHRISKRSLFTLEMAVQHASANDLQVTLTTRKIYPYAGSNLKLHLVLAESHIPETWQTIMTEVNWVCRKMYPDHNGTAADFSGDSIVTTDYNISMDTSWKFNNCELVAFLQDDATKEVLQAEKVNLNALGIDNPKEINLSVYPNPASDMIFVTCEKPLPEIRVYDMAGRQMLDAWPGKREVIIDVTTFHPGFYLLYIQSAQGVVRRKIIISKD